MKLIASTVIAFAAMCSTASAQAAFEDMLCEAAQISQKVELVYANDVSKGCEPRIIDVHQIGLGKDGTLFMHGWQTRGCTAGRDTESARIYKYAKIESVNVIEGGFSEASQSVKDSGWNGCIGTNCIIAENICE